MYGIYANIWGILMVNVTIYSSTMDPKGHDGWYQLDALICLVPSWVILSDSGRGAISILDLHRCNGGICHSLLHAGAHCRTCGLSRLVIKTAVGISTVTIWWSSDLLGIFSKLPKKTGSTTLPPFNLDIVTLSKGNHKQVLSSMAITIQACTSGSACFGASLGVDKHMAPVDSCCAKGNPEALEWLWLGYLHVPLCCWLHLARWADVPGQLRFQGPNGPNDANDMTQCNLFLNVNENN